jgi:hypothetical protein
VKARYWHLLTAVVVVTALVLQTVLVITGAAVMEEGAQPGLAVRLGRLVSYFTIQSNLLVAIAAYTLVRDPNRDGRWWRVIRLAGIVGITVTGLVHWFLLRGILDLHGANWMADKLLHVVVPVLALVGWVVFGPRPRVTGTVAWQALVWPFAYLAAILAIGAASGWYPYPFLDVGLHGYGRVLLAAAGITVLFFALFAGAHLADKRLAPAPRQEKAEAEPALEG